MPAYKYADLLARAQAAVARQRARQEAAWRAQGLELSKPDWRGNRYPTTPPAVPSFGQAPSTPQPQPYSYHAAEQQVFSSMAQAAPPPSPYTQGTVRTYVPTPGASNLPRDITGSPFVDYPADWRRWSQAQRLSAPVDLARARHGRADGHFGPLDSGSLVAFLAQLLRERS